MALRTLGLLAMSQNDYDTAEKWLLQLQQVRPLEDTSYTSLAGIYLSRKQTDKAAAQLLELERHEQKDDRIPRRLAELYIDQKNLPDAQAAAYRAIRINPFNAVDHQLLAQIFVSENQPAKAVEYWQAAADLQPRIVEFWEGLADAKGDSGDALALSAAAKKPLELLPTSKAKRWIQ